MEHAIETRALSRRFGSRLAVAGIDLLVPQRSVYGFLGQNGAGKTTTIRMLLGLLKPSGGRASLFGLDVPAKRREAARLTGALVETPCHYDHLTGRENLAVTRRLLGTDRREIDRVLDIVELSHAADRRVGGYSLGMRQRLGVARALIGRPKLLVLDEPTNGLDPNGIYDMRRLISALPEREGVTIFLSSHVLAELEQIATHVGLMHCGRLLLQSPVGALKRAQRSAVRFTVDGRDAALALLAGRGVGAAADGEDRILIDRCGDDFSAHDVAALNALLVENGIAVSAIEARAPSLEEIFLAAIDAPRPGGSAAFPFARAA